MAVLVTGGAGYIGSHTVLALLARDEEVVVLDNLANASEVSLDRVSELADKDLIFYQGMYRIRRFCSRFSTSMISAP
ncbi:hypothetical protein SODG_005413 [Sodalis praecaptivus]